MRKVLFRYQQVKDAKRFFEILKNKNFRYFLADPKSLKEEIGFLRKSQEKRRKKIAFDYSIVLRNEIVGGCGLKINQRFRHSGEIGYFVDEKHWGKGIAVQAVKFLENLGFRRFGLKRIVILADTRNRQSQRVAQKCGYRKEGHLRKAIDNPKLRPRLRDTYLFAKIR